MPETQRPIRILQLEDSPADAELIARELRRAGVDFTMRRVDTEPAFRSALAQDAPDVILADYRLPSFDGLTALRIARAEAPEVPFIFVSGSLGEERAVEALHEGAADYILKDRPSRLGPAVVRAIRERDEQRARAAAEAAMAESEHRFRYAAIASRDFIFELDPQSGEIVINDPTRSVWGYDEPGRTLDWWIERVHPEDRTRILDALTRWVHSRGKRWEAEFRFRRGDGAYVHVSTHALALRDESGVTVRVIGASQDVTESRRLREQVERAQRVESLGRVAAVVAHEFNNVLMGIQPLAELIARSGDEAAASLAVKIAGSVARGKRIVDEILQIGRVPQPATETFDVAALLHGMKTEVTAIVGSAVNVMLDIPPGPALIRADASQVEQVLYNLVSNARDAMPAGGTLAIAVAQAAERVEVTVSDTGIGMPPEVTARIFEPLFTTKRTGTGLGLAVAHRLLRQNGADIGVESQPGRGTTFRIGFPAAGTTAVEESRAVSESAAAAPGRVLVVEDNSNVSDGMRLLLESEGFRTRVAETGAGALGAVEQWRPDFVVLDVSLPDMSGIEVYDRISERWPDLPVVFTSGHAEVAGLGERARRANVGFVRKPFTLDSLLDCFERLSARKPEGGGGVSTRV